MMRDKGDDEVAKLRKRWRSQRDCHKNVSRLDKSVGMRLTERIMRANLLVKDS